MRETRIRVDSLLAERRVEEAEAEIRELRNSIQADAGRQRDEVLEKARVESDKIIAAAMGVKDRIRRELEAEVGEKSIGYACELIKGVLTTENMKWFHEGLVGEVIGAIDRVEQKRFRGMDESVAMVTTPFELEDATLKRLGGVLSGKLGREVAVKQFTDENIIAGVSVKMGSMVIDGSLAGQLRKTAGKLQSS
jgi:hypothetical protein